VEPDEKVVRFGLRAGAYVAVGEVALADLLAGDVPDLS
jgi:hypothetical protein